MSDPLSQSPTQWVQLLVDCPGAKGLYTYRIPPSLAVSEGDIVSVPFGSQQAGAIAIELLSQPPEGLDPSSIKAIENIINSAFLNKEYLQLLNRVARYYQTPFIRVIRTALPPGLLSRSQRRVRLGKNWQSTVETEHSSTEQDENNQTRAAQVSQGSRQLIEILRQANGRDYSWQYVQQQMKRQHLPDKTVNQALRQSMQQGWVESYLTMRRSPSVQRRQAVVLIKTESGKALTARQQELVTAIKRSGGELWLSDALQLLHTTTATLKKLAAQGYLLIEPREKLRGGSHSPVLSQDQPGQAPSSDRQPKKLNAAQARAVAAIAAIDGYGEVLLHGITGSGKTEVYLQAIAPILAAGKSALVLVPEIGLTPQLTDRFCSRFGKRVWVYHSGLSEGERYDTWRQMLSGEPQVVIGTRSAVFAPLPNLGLIILDEEHDSSFKQDQPMPCYQTHRVARWRAALDRCPLLLGSATPALETWVRFVRSGPERSSRHYLCLPKRIHARPLPPVEIVDMRQELHEGNRTIFSRRLRQALEDLTGNQGQGILFVQRRGHSSFVSCRSCGHVMECPHCDVSLSFHQPHPQAGAYLKCHYCGFGQAHPPRCPACASPYLKNFGSGTQRVVSELYKQIPGIRCLRFDSDTTRRKGAHRALLTRFAKGEADVLVGTQMLTKGIDLPQVTLVGIIAADGLLFMPDFRASERAFQMLTQVAGRAGRGEQPGRVIVQTYSPAHPAVQALCGRAGQADSSPADSSPADSSSADPLAANSPAIDGLALYESFITAELSDRAALAYPPYGKLVLLRVSGLEEAETEQAAQRIATAAQALIEPSAGELLGPVPAPVYRVARRYRWHVLLKFGPQASVPDLTGLAQYSPRGIHLSIDVDPFNMS